MVIFNAFPFHAFHENRGVERTGVKLPGCAGGAPGIEEPGEGKSDADRISLDLSSGLAGG